MIQFSTDHWVFTLSFKSLLLNVTECLRIFIDEKNIKTQKLRKKISNIKNNYSNITKNVENKNSRKLRNHKFEKK